MKITPEKLGQILYEEFKKDNWGDIEPNAFRDLPKALEYPDNEMGGIYEVIERVCKRINK